jgi:hypothetical protein
VISAALLERHRIAERRAFENETAVVSYVRLDTGTGALLMFAAVQVTMIGM